MSVPIPFNTSLPAREPYKQLRDLLKRVTYKPGWEIELLLTGTTYPGGPLLPQLWITFRAPDATGRQEGEITVNKVALLPPYMDNEQEFLRFVECEILDIERHEVHEWLKLDGNCITAPHG